MLHFGSISNDFHSLEDLLNIDFLCWVFGKELFLVNFSPIPLFFMIIIFSPSSCPGREEEINLDDIVCRVLLS